MACSEQQTTLSAAIPKCPLADSGCPPTTTLSDLGDDRSAVAAGQATRWPEAADPCRRQAR